MIYGSVCSGIEAATVAWHPLGWTPAFFSEIEPFPRSVLAHHYPLTPCHGDFTTIGADEYGAIDLLVGGTPCQSFSVAGLRKGLADERGNLALEFLRLADRKGPRWVVWENVPGVLSSNGGRDFGAFLGGLAELGYGFAYRVLDAQFFGVAQRRRRVFVVGYLGDWRRAAAVLFERHSLSGHPAPPREKGEGVAGCLSPGAHPGGFNGQDAYTNHLVTSAVAIRTANTSSNGWGVDESTAYTLDQTQGQAVAHCSTVRRLTPREWERLQGFPDDYTLIPPRGRPALDGPRYKALGNSMAVPVMAWLGERVEQVEALEAMKEAA